jgi:hypothetical protein
MRKLSWSACWRALRADVSLDFISQKLADGRQAIFQGGADAALAAVAVPLHCHPGRH